MYKVVLHVHELRLRVRVHEAVLSVVVQASEGKSTPFEAICLSAGRASIEQEISFYTDSSSIALQLFFNAGEAHKYAGQCRLELEQWDSHAYHEMVVSVRDCPDRKAVLRLDLLYFKTGKHPFSQEETKQELLMHLNSSLLQNARIAQGEHLSLTHSKRTLQKILGDTIQGCAVSLLQQKHEVDHMTTILQKCIHTRHQLLGTFQEQNKSTLELINQTLKKI